MTKTADIILQGLKELGIAHLFCLPGVQNDDFFDALYNEQGTIRPIQVRHEQAAGYMALGAAMATGRPQAYCVVPGPGFLNTTAALSTAYAVNAPVLALIGQIPTPAIDKDYGLLHEIPNQDGILASLTKAATRILDAGEAHDKVHAVLSALINGRPRPVGIECPMNVWGAEVDSEQTLAPLVAQPVAPDPALIEQAAALLDQSAQPLIIVGGGAQHASAEITQLAEMLQAPVSAFRTGHGVLDSRHYLSVTSPLGNELWKDCDVVLAIGTRLQMQQMAWGTDDQLKIIHIDIDEAALGRHTDPAIGILADARLASEALLEALSANNRSRPNRQAEMAERKTQMAERLAHLEPQLSFLGAIRNALPEDGIFVEDLTQVGYVSRFAFPVYQPRTFLTSGYQGTLGWGYASALGAKVACPDRAVVSIAGDGGFMFNAQELASAVRHNIAVVVVVFSDGAFGNVARIQQENYDGRTIASDLKNPSFSALAESFGVMALEAGGPDELETTIKDALDANVPALIEVPCGEMPSPWDMVLLPKVR
ncbi:MAG: thiamine pyrophosphate-binding protein [Arenicellales bacterium]|nr:thiamine pyrophosphate-binding protein [Arenicellales bacterium]